MSLLNLNESVLRIKIGVFGQSTRNGEKGLSKADNTELGLSRNFFSALILHKMLVGSDLEGTTTKNNRLIEDSV